MIRTASLILLLAITIPAAAQVSEPGADSAYPAPKQGDQPDIPGTIMLELGINSALDAPDRFDAGFWGSRTVNVYYTYEMRILNSKFSVVPGIGLSLERFKFKNGATLGYDAEDSLKLFLPAETAAITGEKKISAHHQLSRDSPRAQVYLQPQRPEPRVQDRHRRPRRLSL